MARSRFISGGRDPARFAQGEPAPPAHAVSPWVLLRSANRHPFIYKRMIAAADPAAKPGDVVHVYDKAGQRFGRGLFNPRSQIALRMLTHGDAAVDDAFWDTSLQRAVQLRRDLHLDELTDAYRLVHAEGDGLSGLVAERYADCIVFEFFALGMYLRRDLIAANLAAALGPPSSLDRPGRASPAWRLFFRADEHVRRMEGFEITSPLAGIGPGGHVEHTATPQVPGPKAPAPPSVTIREHNIRYQVDIAAGHKTGFFCDQRDNRRRFAALCRQVSVLDLCCYTAGFGLCAKILGDASSVTSVDLDEAALEIARTNCNLNNARIDLVHSDAFTYVRQMITNGRLYDRVVLDPPKFVPTRDDMNEGLRKYHDLNALAFRVIRPGGMLLTCSCSGLVSREVFLDAVQRAGHATGRKLQLIDQTGAAADHPIMMNCPESAYLKALWFRVL